MNRKLKMKIDEEIKRFFLEVDIRKQILPNDTLPDYLQKLRNHVLEIHSWLDGDMLVRILSEIRYKAGDALSNETWEKVNLLIQDSLVQISYSSKIAVIQAYGDVDSTLAVASFKVNTLRNEFAHKRPDHFLQKYDLNTPKGKQNIRDVIRALKTAQDLFLAHGETSKACLYYVNKQFELMKADEAKQKPSPAQVKV